MKKQVSILLAVACMIGTIGCSRQVEEATVSASPEPEAVVLERTIVDQNDRSVILPERVDRIATGRILPFPAVYFLATGKTDEIVGIHPASKSAAKTSILGKMAPRLLEAKTDFVQGNNINVEELLKLDTDVVFVYGDNGHNIEAYDEAGITSVGIRTMSIAQGDSIETLNSWLVLLGQITEQEDRAMEIIEYGRRVEANIHETLSNVTDKPRGLMIFTYADGKPVVSGKGFFGNYWLNATGAIDVAEEEIQIKAPVDMEQIYMWNPEVLYITNFTDLQPDDFYNNSIEGQDWSEVEAVKNKRVYKIPLGIYRWFPPSGDSPLMLQWLAKTNHPDLFTYEMNDIIAEYYERYYGYVLSDDEVEMILNPSDLSSEGYSN
jgi:iron complex transport system substrate-binding protein